MTGTVRRRKSLVSFLGGDGGRMRLRQENARAVMSDVQNFPRLLHQVMMTKNTKICKSVSDRSSRSFCVVANIKNFSPDLVNFKFFVDSIEILNILWFSRTLCAFTR